MYIINVIPLIKIPRPNPQILSYFSNSKLPKGALAQITLRRKKINALVLSSEKLEEKRIDIKKSATYELKPIEKIISKNPVLTPKQFELLLWFAEYYYSPLGLVARLFIPQNLIIAKRARENYRIPLIKRGRLILTPENKKEIFKPFSALKSIIIKNADNDRYKSWGRKPYYNAQILAVQLAKIFKAKVTLKTNLPKVETYYWSQNKKYKLAVRGSQFSVYSSKIIDMKEEIKKNNYSILSRELQEQLKKSSKSILYIPRRGSSTCILCRDCGHVLKCPRCDVPLVCHLTQHSPFSTHHSPFTINNLLCHHCGNKETPPSTCPNCKGHRIKYFGAGTQKVEIEIKKIFPKINVFRLDSDIAKNPKKQQKIIDKFCKSKKAILIGTQMIFDKRIKSVNLVGIISMETILNLPDYKSSEIIFRTINRLKDMTENNLLIQAYNPKNFAIKTAIDNNWKVFYNNEVKIRKALNYPPFSQIIKLLFAHKNSKEAEQEAKILFEKLKQGLKHLAINNKQLAIIGPVPAFIPKMAGKYRWHIIIKVKFTVGYPQKEKIRKRNKLLTIVPSTWDIEVDPESML